ncbi:MAG: DUF433 domain-containing protein [Actinomycetota bacterium]
MARAEAHPAEVFPGITMDPEVRFGKPCIAGTRVDVATVVGAMAAGESVETIQKEYSLTLDQVNAALRYATHLADHAPPAVKQDS